MTRVFPSNSFLAAAKHLPNAIAGIFNSLRGGILADFEPYTSSGSTTVLDPVVYQSTVNTGGTAGAEVVSLAAGASVGQRHLILMGTRANAADIVRIQAGADTTLKRDATAVAPVVVSKLIPAVQYAAGTSVFALATVSGRITRVQVVTDVITAGVGTITLELATVLVAGSSVTVATAAAVGDLDDSGAIADVIPASNIVKKGDPIEIVSNGTPTLGVVEVFIEITPDAEQAPVVVDALIPATQYAAGTSVFAVAPVAGNISRFRSIADVLTAGLGALTLEIASVEVVGSDVAVANASAIGVADDSGAIAGGATTLVAAGDQIELVSDGVPTAGLLDCKIEIAPTIKRGPVIVEKVFTATELAAGTSVFAVSPIAGHIGRVWAVSDVAITVGDVEVGIELGGVNVAGSDVTVAFTGAAIGDVDDSGAIAQGATTDVAAAGAIEITSDGGNTAGSLHVYIEIDPATDVVQIDLAEPGDYALMEFDGAAWNYVKGSGALA